MTLTAAMSDDTKAEPIFHVLENEDGVTALCGAILNDPITRAPVNQVDRDARCGMPECQDAFQAIELEFHAAEET